MAMQTKFTYRVCDYFELQHMTTLDEYCEKCEWWLNELRSLGLEVNKLNEFNDIGEISTLVNKIKGYYYSCYRNSYTLSD
jgi:hypothetical protein